MRWFISNQSSEVLAVHAALLRTGRIIYFGGDEHDKGQHDRNQIDHSRIFDCTTLQIQAIASPSTDVFCSGHAMLRDGRLLVAGGTEAFPFEVQGPHSPHFPGLRNTWVFDPGSNAWSEVAPMNFEPGRSTGGGRWYPTLVTLPSGQIMAMSGHPSSSDTRAQIPLHKNDSPETYTTSPTPQGTWLLSGPSAVSDETSYYPRLHVLPSGRFFCSTPFQNGFNFQFDRTGWIFAAPGPADPLYRDIHATSVLLPLLPGDGYRPRVLLCGGSQPVTIDLAAASPVWRPTLPRTLSGSPERQNLNAVILPTGDVFICGGVVNPSDDSSAVLEAELYQPSTDSWITLPGATVVRNYHSVALLMPDGRIWTAGSNRNAQQSFPAPGVDNRELRIEIFEPSYFTANRPQITSWPSNVFYGQTFQIQTPQAPSINRVAVVRTGSVTHSFNFDQRYVGLQFSHSGSNALSAVAPPNGSVAPPGYYLLFVIDQEGVPSTGRFIAFVSKPKEKEKEVKEILKEKDKDRELVKPAEGPTGGLQGDPLVLIAQLTRRVEQLEGRLATGQAFIMPEERPDLGEELFTPDEPLEEPAPEENH